MSQPKSSSLIPLWHELLDVVLPPICLACRTLVAATQSVCISCWQKLSLIDDVLTTGATAGECAKVLLAAEASKVLVLTLARVTRVE